MNVVVEVRGNARKKMVVSVDERRKKKKEDAPVPGVRGSHAVLVNVFKFPHPILDISACNIQIWKGEDVRNQSVRWPKVWSY